MPMICLLNIEPLGLRHELVSLVLMLRSLCVLGTPVIAADGLIDKHVLRTCTKMRKNSLA